MTLALVVATVGVFVGGPILIGLALSRAGRCATCRRRVDGEPHYRIPGRGLLCNACIQSAEPEGPE